MTLAAIDSVEVFETVTNDHDESGTVLFVGPTLFAMRITTGEVAVCRRNGVRSHEVLHWYGRHCTLSMVAREVGSPS